MRRAGLLLAATMLAISVTPATAVPPIAGGALASDNIDFVANIEVPGGAAGARILGDTMYVTGSGGLWIYDLSLGVPAPVAHLPLPHFGNEDVDTNGEILLISADNAFSFPQVRLYVIDVTPKAAGVIVPVLLATIRVPDGHTVSCINDCSYAWLAGDEDVMHVVDLHNPSNPQLVGQFDTRVGRAHDVQTDDAGISWVVGGGGIAGFTTADPVNPALHVVQNGQFDNDFILHNSLRPDASQLDPAKLSDGNVDTGELMLITEEDWLSFSNGLCDFDGSFQTGHYKRLPNGTLTLELLDTLNLGNLVLDGTQKPLASLCSSHYFDYRDDDIVAIGWYEQGVRFVDVSNPRDIRQVGYFMPPLTGTWSVKWHGDYLYTFDYVRGIDVLRFTGTGGDPEVLAPRWNEPPVLLTVPSPEWGNACKIPVV